MNDKVPRGFTHRELTFPFLAHLPPASVLPHLASRSCILPILRRMPWLFAVLVSEMFLPLFISTYYITITLHLLRNGGGTVNRIGILSSIEPIASS